MTTYDNSNTSTMEMDMDKPMDLDDDVHNHLPPDCLGLGPGPGPARRGAASSETVSGSFDNPISVDDVHAHDDENQVSTKNECDNKNNQNQNHGNGNRESSGMADECQNAPTAADDERNFLLEYATTWNNNPSQLMTLQPQQQPASVVIESSLPMIHRDSSSPPSFNRHPTTKSTTKFFAVDVDNDGDGDGQQEEENTTTAAAAAAAAATATTKGDDATQVGSKECGRGSKRKQNSTKTKSQQQTSTASTTATTKSSSSFVMVPPSPSEAEAAGSGSVPASQNQNQEVLSPSDNDLNFNVIVDDADDNEEPDITVGDEKKKHDSDNDNDNKERARKEEFVTNNDDDSVHQSSMNHLVAKSLDNSFAAVAATVPSNEGICSNESETINADAGETVAGSATARATAVFTSTTTPSNSISVRDQASADVQDHSSTGHDRPVASTPPPKSTKLAPRLSRSVPPKILPPQQYQHYYSIETNDDHVGIGGAGSACGDTAKKDEQLISLFGGNVGKFVMDVSASYFRVSGRLFVSTCAIMFYSNIFGFERRLCLTLSDVLSIESFRSTSIKITMIDCEDFVFKRIEHRDSTLAVLTNTLRKFKASEGGRLPQMTGFVTLVDSGTKSHLQQMEDYRQSMLLINNNGDNKEIDVAFQYDVHHEESLRRPRLSSEHTLEQDTNNENELLLYPNTQGGGIEAEFMTTRDSSTSIPSISEYCPIRRRSLSVPTLHATQTKFDFSQQKQKYTTPQIDTSKDQSVTTLMGTKATNSCQQSPADRKRKSIPRAVSVPLESSKTAREGGRFDDFIERFDIAASGHVSNIRLNGKNLRHSKSLENDSPTSKASSQPRRPHNASHSKELVLSSEEKKEDDYDLLGTTKVRTSWMEAKVTNPNVAVAPLLLESCTLDDFFALFLADDAPNSLAKYQKEVVGDMDLQFQNWMIDDKPSVKGATSVRRRSIKYIHPVKGGIGPSSAKTIRQQCLSRFGRIGMLLENTTEVSGIPMADCFKIYDQWIIELKDAPTPSVSFSVTFKIDFVKRTMFKGMIQKSIQAETKEWFKGYVSMVQKALKEHIAVQSKKEKAEKEELKPSQELLSQVQRKGATIESIEVSIDQSAESLSKSNTRRRSSVFSAISKVIPTSGILTEETATASSLNRNEQLFDKPSIDLLSRISILLVLMVLLYYLTLIQRRLSDIEDQLLQMNTNAAALVRLLESQRVEYDR